MLLVPKGGQQGRWGLRFLWRCDCQRDVLCHSGCGGIVIRNADVPSVCGSVKGGLQGSVLLLESSEHCDQVILCDSPVTCFLKLVQECSP